jgi:hypothetical protein
MERILKAIIKFSGLAGILLGGVTWYAYVALGRSGMSESITTSGWFVNPGSIMVLIGLMMFLAVKERKNDHH